MTIKGLDNHLTAGPPEQPDPRHWHVSRHSDDDDVFITEDFWSALKYAKGEVDSLAEFEQDGISCMGDSGDFEGAYNAFKRSNELDAVQMQAAHALEQHNKRDLDEDESYDYGVKHRAPLFQGPGGDEKIVELALRAVERINSETPVSMWECDDELVYVNDQGIPVEQDLGNPAHADDYYPPARWTRGPEPTAMTEPLGGKQPMEEICDECGNEMPIFGSGLINPFHADSCSLNPASIV